jgi:long-chain acyl-CoA synthetase
MQLISGMQAGFYRGDTTKLVDDVGILAPTLFPSVPRLYNRIYSKIKSGIDEK